MRIIYISISSRCDGSVLCLLNLLDVLVANHKVQPLVILSSKGYLSDELIKRKIPFHAIPMFFSIYPTTENLSRVVFSPLRLLVYMFFNFIAMVKVIFIAKKFKPNLIHTNNGVVRCGFYAAKFLKIPHIWHLREYQDLGLGFKIFPCKIFFLKLLSTRGNYSVAITQGIADHFRPAESRVVYDGVRKKSEIIKSFDIKKEDYILYVGNLNEQKGFTDLLHAWNSFCKENNHFILKVAGESIQKNYQNFYLNYIRQNNLTNRIEILGVRHDIDFLMQHARALVVPSYFEGFGRITAEAMLNYCLVVGRDSAGTAEILKTQHLGELFSSQEQLIEILHKICNASNDEYQLMIQKAYETAVKLYLTEDNAENIYKFYLDVLEHCNS